MVPGYALTQNRTCRLVPLRGIRLRGGVFPL
jgi:hypothetical protein